MTKPGKTRLLAAVAAVVLGSACSREYVAESTTDAVIWTGKTAVRGAYGAGKLAYRGAAAGVSRLSEPKAGYPAGTVVCLDDDGEIYSAAEIRQNEAICPPQ